MNGEGERGRGRATLLEHCGVRAVDVVGGSLKRSDARPSMPSNEYGARLADVLDGLAPERVCFWASRGAASSR